MPSLRRHGVVSLHLFAMEPNLVRVYVEDLSIESRWQHPEIGCGAFGSLCGQGTEARCDGVHIAGEGGGRFT